MSDRPPLTERLRRDLDELAGRAPLLNPESPDFRRHPPTSSKRVRPLHVAGAVIAVAALVVVGVVVAQRVGRPSRQVVTTGPASAKVSYQPSSRLVVLARGTLQVVNATTGAVIRTVAIHGPTNKLGDGLTVSPNSRSVYTGRGATLCRNSSVVRISLVTGDETTVVAHALHPALSPNGDLLAYTAAVAPPKRFGEPQFCETGRTFVRNLATGRIRSWNITAHPGGDHADLYIGNLTWASDSRRLLLSVTGSDIPASEIKILDVTRAMSTTNPTNVGGRTTYDSPILLPDGDIMGVVDTCHNNASCPGESDPPSPTIHVIEPGSGRVVSSFRGDRGEGGLTIDASGQRIEVAVSRGDQVTLEQLIGHHPTLKEADFFGSFGWIPSEKPSAVAGHAAPRKEPFPQGVGGIVGEVFPGATISYGPSVTGHGRDLSVHLAPTSHPATGTPLERTFAYADNGWKLHLAVAVAATTDPTITSARLTNADGSIPEGANNYYQEEPINALGGDPKLDTLSLSRAETQLRSNLHTLSTGLGAGAITRQHITVIPIDSSRDQYALEADINLRGQSALHGHLGDALDGLDTGLIGNASSLIEGLAVVVTIRDAPVAGVWSAVRYGSGASEFAPSLHPTGDYAPTLTFPDLTGGPHDAGTAHG
jgi:hypothetical protein